MKKVNFLLGALLCLVALITSCKKDDTDPVKPQVKITADAGADQSVTVGQTITLDASPSKDDSGKPLNFSWAITKKPTNSTATLSSTTVAKPTFSPDMAGEFEFEVTVSNENGSAKDKVAVTATGSVVAQILKDDIKADLVLANIVADPTKPDYIVTADINVEAKLTINPGVVIEFEANKGLYVDNSPVGSIIAKGTSAQKIVFTGKQKTAGFWKGIMVYSSSPLNEFDFVEVSYGGSTNLVGVSVKSNLVLYGNNTPGGSLKITNSSFTNSGGYGLYIERGDAVLTGFANNTVTNNLGNAMYVEADQIHMLDAASKFNNANAGYNGVEIDGFTRDDAPEVTWPAFTDGSKYLVSNDIEIKSIVKIAPGATFEFATGKALYVDNNPMGTLIAKGTAAQKITFTGKQKTNGFWKGIMVYSSSTLNEMDFVEVSYGGSTNLVGVSVKSNLVVYGNATPGGSLKITNSSFTHSGGYGLYIEDGTAILTGFANNTVSNNTGNAMYVEIDELHKLDAASKFNSNNIGFNGVEIEGATKPNSDEVTWPAFTDGSKYLVSSDLEINSGVKIAPGATFEFAADKALYVDDQGAYLVAKGTAAQKITFTGKQKNKGFWRGIMIYSASTLNEMDFVEISYGGSNNLVGVSAKSNLVVYHNGSTPAALKITNSSITNSAGYGIYALSDIVAINPDFETANVYTANAAGNVMKK
jgi:hypothetical protein